MHEYSHEYFICFVVMMHMLQRRECDMLELVQEMKWKRSDYVISTKIFWGGSGPNDKGLSRKHVVEGTKVMSAICKEMYTCVCTRNVYVFCVIWVGHRCPMCCLLQIVITADASVHSIHIPPHSILLL